MSKAIFEAIKMIEQQNGIPAEMLIEKLKIRIRKAVEKDYPNSEIRVVVDPEAEEFSVGLIKTVVEGEPEDPATQITKDQALTYDTAAYVGGIVEIPIDTKKLRRVSVNPAKQDIRSDIKQFEREKMVEQYKDKEHELVIARVQKIEPKGNAIITIDKDEIYFPRSEQIPDESYIPGELIKVYVVDINAEKKPYIRVSRSHQDFVRRLFELEVPEIFDGSVEIKAISREAGARSKVAVYAQDPNIDPIGACIGPKQARIAAIRKELHGEKIDLIPYSENDSDFIAAALAPAEVISVTVDEGETKSCTVVVPDNQLSLAIGNRGQNAKLAARLTKYKIDIISEEQAKERAKAAEAEVKEDEPAEEVAEVTEAAEENHEEASE